MALSVKHGLSSHQVDVTVAFLNETLEDEVYMQQPKGFECQGVTCKHNKSIYRLKQLPCCWNSTFDIYQKEMLISQATSSLYTCIYFWKNGKDMIFIGVYVYDTILAASETQLKQIKDKLSDKVDIKDLDSSALLE